MREIMTKKLALDNGSVILIHLDREQNTISWIKAFGPDPDWSQLEQFLLVDRDCSSALLAAAEYTRRDLIKFRKRTGMSGCVDYQIYTAHSDVPEWALDDFDMWERRLSFHISMYGKASPFVQDLFLPDLVVMLEQDLKDAGLGERICDMVRNCPRKLGYRYVPIKKFYGNTVELSGAYPRRWPDGKYTPGLSL